tara:strand:+ start:246 stop:632 length:387 start_codon:yes stop_codon:yes gene_type:complete
MNITNLIIKALLISIIKSIIPKLLDMHEIFEIAISIIIIEIISEKMFNNSIIGGYELDHEELDCNLICKNEDNPKLCEEICENNNHINIYGGNLENNHEDNTDLLCKDICKNSYDFNCIDNCKNELNN